jgi:predicted kinase
MPKKTEILIVCGPPGSGKTTYVREHKWDEDLIWDFDAVMQAITGLPLHDQSSRYSEAMNSLDEGAMGFLIGLREKFCAMAAHGDGRVRRVWIIVCKRSAFTADLEKLGAVILELNTPVEVCMERMEARSPAAVRTFEQYLART